MVQKRAQYAFFNSWAIRGKAAPAHPYPAYVIYTVLITVIMLLLWIAAMPNNVVVHTLTFTVQLKATIDKAELFELSQRNFCNIQFLTWVK